MTASSASPSSGSELPLALEARDLHLWVCRARAVPDSLALARAVLSRYAAPESGAWRFEKGCHGKPALVGAPRPLDFNLSDSGDWRVCAVTAGTAVGVDLEHGDSRRDVMKLARRFYDPAEVAALEACAPTGEQRARFYDFWTLKEARVKAQGLALGPALASVAVLGIFPLGIGHTLYNAALRRTHPTRVNIIATQEVTGGILLSWWLLGDAPTVNALVGALIMLAGVIQVVI